MIYEATFQTIPLLFVAALWYLIVTTCFNRSVIYRAPFFPGLARARPPTFFRQVRKNFITFHASVLQGPPLEARPSHDAVPMVKAVKVRKSFGNLQVLNGVSLEIARGEVMVLIGPSGRRQEHLLALHQPSREDRRRFPFRRRRARGLQAGGRPSSRAA